MRNLFEKLKSLSRVQLIAFFLIAFGAALMIPKAMGMFNFYKEVQFAVENDFASGNLSPDLLRPWMTIRYISSAYAVPQQYLFDTAKIQPRRETSLISLERLNRQMKLGQVNDQPALMTIIRGAIIAYRANPVATGLIEQHVEDWMTVQYIANSTGIPAETLLRSVDIPTKGNTYKPLGYLSEEVNYPGGTKALVAAIQAIVDAQGVKPVIP